MGEVILEWVSGSLSNLGNIFTNYFYYGAPFAFAHVVVAVMLVYQTWYNKIRVETEALKVWSPGAGPAQGTPGRPRSARASRGWLLGNGEAETTRILDQFVYDCDKLGRQGFFVPMTDFSDRLDSIVDGIMAEMHDRTNLFILVGVAGTLLGIFEFAFKSQAALASANLPEMGRILTSSMSQAFPVGFVGLALTFCAQVIASFPERKLRTALARATGEALKVREEMSNSQAQLVQESVAAMERAMGPLKNMQDTLQGFVQPTLDRLGKHLDDSLKLVESQFAEIRQTHAGTQEIVRAVDGAVGSLRDIVAKLDEHARQTRAINENTLVLQKQQQEATARTQKQQEEALAAFNDTATANLEQVRLINDSLVGALQSVDALPERMRHAVQMKLGELAEGTLSDWRDMSGELKALVLVDHNNMLDKVEAQARSVEDSLLRAATHLQGVATGASGAVAGLSALPEQLREEVARNFGTLFSGSADYWRGSTDSFALDMRGVYGRYFDDVGAEAKKVTEALQGAASSLADTSRVIEDILGRALKRVIAEATQEVKKELADGLSNIDQVFAQRYPKIHEDVVATSDSLRVAVEHVRAIQSESAAWLEGVRDSQQKMAEINGLLVEALNRMRDEHSSDSAEQARGLLRQNVEEVKRLNALFASLAEQLPAPEQVRTTSERVQSELGSVNLLLSQIHESFVKREQRETSKRERKERSKREQEEASTRGKEEDSTGEKEVEVETVGFFGKVFRRLRHPFGGNGNR